MWVATASLLAAFDIECLQDEKGQDVFPEAIFNDGIARYVNYLKFHAPS